MLVFITLEIDSDAEHQWLRAVGTVRIFRKVMIVCIMYIQVKVAYEQMVDEDLLYAYTLPTYIHVYMNYYNTCTCRCGRTH